MSTCASRSVCDCCIPTCHIRRITVSAVRNVCADAALERTARPAEMKAKRERRMWESSGFDLRSTGRGGRVKRGEVRRRFDPHRMFFVGMQIREAVALIADAISRDAGNIWADFGAGDGTFARALV